jgi:hypothetical protein
LRNCFPGSRPKRADPILSGEDFKEAGNAV